MPLFLPSLSSNSRRAARSTSHLYIPAQENRSLFIITPFPHAPSKSPTEGPLHFMPGLARGGGKILPGVWGNIALLSLPDRFS